MPIYQYKCNECSCEFELRKSFKDETNHVTCPDCGGKAKRKISAPGIIFKGSGFYVTDYKTNSTISSGEDKVKEKPKKDVAKDVAKDIAATSKPGGSTEIPI